MAEQPILITSYKDPDLDGTACAVAYTELLTKQGRLAKVGIFGQPHREARFVMRQWSVPTLPDGSMNLLDNAEVILVDASETHSISEKINRDRVVEIIDHRRHNHADQFPNAKLQIEFVGAAATLIAERFHQAKIDPSPSSAALLFFAIVSNTINFKNNVTTERDRTMADWLKKFFPFREDDIAKVFRHKSKLDKPLKLLFMEDFGWHEFNHRKMTIFQLEIMDVKNFVKNNHEVINEVLKEIKAENNFDFVLLTIIDIYEGFNMFVVIDDLSEKIMKNALGATFEDGVAYHDGIIMRKEMVPKIKEEIEKL